MATVDRVCRFCGRCRPLVKAHIIPAAFFRAIGTGKDAPILISNRSDSPHPKRIPIGPYDRGILCDTCERRFDQVDAYGTKTLLHTLRGAALKPLQRDGHVYGFEADGIDQELLLRFFVATLWRAAVSTLPIFHRVRLNERHEALAKEAVTTSTLSSDFGAVLAAFFSPTGQSESIGWADPIRQRSEGVNCYRFYFGPYHAQIKVDQRPFTGPFLVASLGRWSRLGIIRRDFKNSKDFASLRRTAIEQHENSLRHRSKNPLKS